MLIQVMYLQHSKYNVVGRTQKSCWSTWWRVLPEAWEYQMSCSFMLVPCGRVCVLIYPPHLHADWLFLVPSVEMPIEMLIFSSLAIYDMLSSWLFLYSLTSWKKLDSIQTSEWGVISLSTTMWFSLSSSPDSSFPSETFIQKFCFLLLIICWTSR